MMDRILEEEIMDEAEQVTAYANANFEKQDNNFVQTFHDFFNRSGHVLDLGCGPAKIIAKICLLNSNIHVTGLDGSVNMLEKGKTYCQTLGVLDRVTLIKGYIPDIRLDRQSYDAIISNSLLHHLPNPNVLWQFIKKYTTKGTAVMVVDLFRPENIKKAEDIVDEKAFDEPEILRRDFFNSLLAAFTPKEVNSQLKAANLALECKMISDIHWIVKGIIN